MLKYIKQKIKWKKEHWKKEEKTTVNFRKKIKSDETISIAFVQIIIRYCCITHVLQSGVKTAFKKIGHKPDKGQMVKSHKILRFIMLSRGFVDAIGIV